MEPFQNKYNWKGINHPSGTDDLKKIEKNNSTISFDALCVKK